MSVSPLNSKIFFGFEAKRIIQKALYIFVLPKIIFWLAKKLLNVKLRGEIYNHYA